MPADGLSGFCYVHYGGQIGKHKMKVKIVNGKRDGLATLMKDGTPYMELEYKNGKLTGKGKVLNQDGIVDLIGQLVDRETDIEPVSIESCSSERRIRDFLTSAISQTNDFIIVFDIVTGDECRVIRVNEKCYAMKWSEEEKCVIEVDLNCCDMKYWKEDHWISISHETQCIDLDVSGRRWEGGVKDGKLFGFGVLYDEEGRKEYEGFMMNGKKVCYGKEYYPDVACIRYDGCFCEDKRFGKGILYDRNGKVEYDGLWKNDEPHSVGFDGRTIDNYTEVIEIPDKSFNKVESFILPSFLYSLKRIVIGDHCFRSVRVFELDGLRELESVVIGEWSFMISSDERSDGSYRIVNCPKLKSIQIGHFSFCNYHSFEISNLTSLEAIEFGFKCFYSAPLFSLTGLID